jgi:hypothetical protein
MSLNHRATERQPFDPAALAGAVVAGAIAVYMSPGPYNLMSIVIGGTLLSIIAAYEYGRRRDWPQTVALGAVVGFVGLLPVGLCLEFFLGHGSLAGDCRGDACESRVEPWMLFVVWAILVAAVVARDRKVQS